MMCNSIIKFSALIALVFSLFGCAGSPVHTSSLSPSRLQTIDDYTLCKAFTPREAYEPSYKVISEVYRRGINCAAIYQYRSLAPTIRALQAIQDSSTKNYDSKIRGTLKRNYVSGLNRVCIYNQGGSDRAITIERGKICPLSL